MKLSGRMTARQSVAVLLSVVVIVSAGVLLAVRSTRAVSAPHPDLLGDARSVERDPSQGPPPANRVFVFKGYEIEALARFDMEARVLRLEYYSGDRESDLCPVDAVVGWGPMSRAEIVNRFDIQQEHRWCYWESYDPPLSAEEVIRHSANMHFIPADDQVAQSIMEMRRHDIIRVRGYLVEARASDGWTWTSSLTRDDTGNRSCEIIYVQQLEVQR